MGEKGGFCQLDDGRIFFCGGNKGVVTNSAFFIYKHLNHIEKLADMKNAKTDIGMCPYYQQKIFVFGGKVAGANSALCERYDMIQNIWEPIENFHIASSNMTSVVHENRIFITGHSALKVYQYSPDENIYSPSTADVGGVHKVLCKVSEKLYLLTNMKIFVFGEDWTEILNTPTILPDSPLKSYTVRNDHYIYMLLPNNKVYSFDAREKKVLEVYSI